jgi:hypothetical protein
VKENYYALLICILKPVTVEQSFDLYEGRITKVQNKSISKDDVEDMIRMKQQGMTHREIGSFYGLSEEATYRRIKRYKEGIICKIL